MHLTRRFHDITLILFTSLHFTSLTYANTNKEYVIHDAEEKTGERDADESEETAEDDYCPNGEYFSCHHCHRCWKGEKIKDNRIARGRQLNAIKRYL